MRARNAARAASCVFGLLIGAALAQDPPAPAPQGGEPATGTQGEPQPAAPVKPAPGEPQAAPATEPASLTEYKPVYRMLVEIQTLVQQWCSAAGELVHPLDLGVTSGGAPVPVPVLEIARPGSTPPAERPTVFLIGGLDGTSLSGGEAVLSIVYDLLRHPESLPADVSFVAVPWASPEALTFALANDNFDGRNARASDDDRDGRVDEDGPDDLDGDGMTLSMLIEDPRGRWSRSSDPRFLVPAGPADGVRYILCREGRDDDGDGRFNEDPLGGVVLDLNFPVGRVGSWTGELMGPLPLCDGIARALADLVVQRRAVCVLLFQGNHGLAACPGGFAPADGAGELVAAADRPLFERASEAFQAATGRRQKNLVSLRDARGELRAGAALDWMYAVGRALALEVAVWGPQVEASAEVSAQDARFPQGANAKSPHAIGLSNGRAAPSDGDKQWANWLDNLHGGLGFVDWHPVELGHGTTALVGGWEPRTVDNPPADSLARSLKGVSEFVRNLGAGMPRLEVRVASAVRDGEVCKIRARVRNLGLLPTGLAGGRAASGQEGLALELALPAGAQLLAGRANVVRERLLGGESTDEYEWVVLAPEGSTFTLRASSEWTLPAAREIKP